MTRLASDIREVQKPIYCSACFNSQPIRHVDFDAACDRGYGNDEGIQVAMDDLILCENCVRVGAELLGMSADATLKERIADLERRLDLEEKRARQAQNWAERMEEALAARPEKVAIDHRKRPRKDMEAA